MNNEREIIFPNEAARDEMWAYAKEMTKQDADGELVWNDSFEDAGDEVYEMLMAED